jgi:hypothetical protein
LYKETFFPLAGTLLFDEKIRQSPEQAVFEIHLEDLKPSSEHNYMWFPYMVRSKTDRLEQKQAVLPIIRKLGDTKDLYYAKL